MAQCNAGDDADEWKEGACSHGNSYREIADRARVAATDAVPYSCATS